MILIFTIQELEILTGLATGNAQLIATFGTLARTFEFKQDLDMSASAIAVDPTEKIFLNLLTGDTYIHEASAGVFEIVEAGNVISMPAVSGADTLGALGTAATWTAVQTFVAPVLGTPTSGVMTNVTGLTNAGIVAAAGIDLSKIDAITFTESVPCTISVAEGTVAFPDIHVLATAGAKISGWVLPDVTASTINFKCVVPSNLASTPAMLVRVRFMTLTADTAHAVRLTVSTAGHAVNENMDVSLTAETEVTAECPDATETMNEALIEIDLTTDWASGDTVIGQLKRDPVDAVDDYAGDILIVGIFFQLDPLLWQMQTYPNLV